MMFVVFGFLAAALIAGWFGRRSYSLILLSIFFILAVHLFLWEIHSPDYGYKMPWIQVQLVVPAELIKLA